uniref:Uncharacterized protein n=1 Tax=Oryza sativa subsp. japonica TaxID=39947 RepID=Q5JNC8_ORYSJ|nr:hypothetical protein [Oryza sativa Japonica Group]BAD87029.1 hypothetical protein [Oryza sativa Japonica Group]
MTLEDYLHPCRDAPLRTRCLALAKFGFAGGAPTAPSPLPPLPPVWLAGLLRPRLAPPATRPRKSGGPAAADGETSYRSSLSGRGRVSPRICFPGEEAARRVA